MRILVNIVPREFQVQKPEGPQAPRFFLPWNLPRDNIHQDTPKAFPHIKCWNQSFGALGRKNDQLQEGNAAYVSLETYFIGLFQNSVSAKLTSTLFPFDLTITFEKGWYNIWKSYGVILVNFVPRKFQGQEPTGPQAPRVLALETPKGQYSPGYPKAFPHITILL